jgi:hypothetical protein
MTMQMTKCTECGEQFQLEPNKPGYANVCPGCSPPKALSPAEAKEAHQHNNREVANTWFYKEIQEKREAEARGDWALANEIEVRIQELDKARSKVPRKRVP